MRIRVWDAPTRLAHWLIVALFALAWWTEAHDQMAVHLMAGYALAGVVAFRLAWGFAGGSTARFSSFVRGPRAVARYARYLVRGGEHDFVPGHNPMGGWSVLALLATLAATIGSGLFASDVDGVASGPLAGKVSYDVSAAAAHWHAIGFNLLLGLAALHLLAVGFYLVVRREDLVGPMVHGARRAPPTAAPLRPAGLWRFVLAALFGLAVAVALARGV